MEPAFTMPLDDLCPVSKQSKREEAVNIVTHGLGLLLSLVALTSLLYYSTQQGGTWLILSCSVFGLALVMTYSASTLYHSRRSEKAKQAWRVVDHLSIYLLIAGTYTPFCLLGFKDTSGLYLLVFVWSMAVIGITFKAVFGHRYRWVELFAYLAMGCSVLLLVSPLKQSLPGSGFAFLFAGGVAYLVGVLFYVWKRLPYNHGIWHLFVLAGSVCHFFAVTQSFFQA